MINQWTNQHFKIPLLKCFNYMLLLVSVAACLAHPLETVLVDDGALPLVTSLLLAHFRFWWLLSKHLHITFSLNSYTQRLKHNFTTCKKYFSAISHLELILYLPLHDTSDLFLKIFFTERERERRYLPTTSSDFIHDNSMLLYIGSISKLQLHKTIKIY